MKIAEFQKKIEDIYFEKDSGRGLEGTFMWFTEEVGELARALKSGSMKDREEEFADCLAWLVSLGSIAGVNVEEAVKNKYGSGCPKCLKEPCMCDETGERK